MTVQPKKINLLSNEAISRVVLDTVSRKLAALKHADVPSRVVKESFNSWLSALCTQAAAIQNMNVITQNQGQGAEESAPQQGGGIQ